MNQGHFSDRGMYVANYKMQRELAIRHAQGMNEQER